MATRNIVDIRSVAAGDRLCIHLTRKGLTRISHIEVLLIRGDIQALPKERERIRSLQKAEKWPWNDNRILEVAATDRFCHRSLQTALSGFMEGPIERPLPSTTAPATRTRTAWRETTNRIDLTVVEAVLGLGFKKTTLARLLGVGSGTVAHWMRLRRTGTIMVHNHTPKSSRKLDAVYNATTSLIESGMSERQAVRWWSDRNPTLSYQRPQDVLRQGNLITEVEVSALDARSQTT